MYGVEFAVNAPHGIERWADQTKHVSRVTQSLLRAHMAPCMHACSLHVCMRAIRSCCAHTRNTMYMVAITLGTQATRDCAHTCNQRMRGNPCAAHARSMFLRLGARPPTQCANVCRDDMRGACVALIVQRIGAADQMQAQTYCLGTGRREGVVGSVCECVCVRVLMLLHVIGSMGGVRVLVLVCVGVSVCLTTQG